MVGKAVIYVVRSALASLFMKGKYEILEGLPKDAKIVESRYDERMDWYAIVFESNELPEVPEGALVPRFTVVVSFKVVEEESFTQNTLKRETNSS